MIHFLQQSKNMARLFKLYLFHHVVAESDLAWLKIRPTENRLSAQWTKSRGHGPLVRGVDIAT